MSQSGSLKGMSVLKTHNRSMVDGWTGICLALVGLLVLVASLGTPADAQERDSIEVGFVYVGPVGDFGWSYAHDQGRKALEDELGDRVTTRYVESVPEVDVADVTESLARQGTDLVFGTSFGYMDPMLEIAEFWPDVAFMHSSGFKTGPNMGNYYGRMYEAQYLAGMLAGLQTESDVLGYVAPHPVPTILVDINAFFLGAQKTNPDVEMRLVWTNQWHDPSAAREAAMSVIDLGADVIGHAQDSPAPAQAAEERGVYSVGYHMDQYEFAPDAILTSTVWDWGVIYVDQARDVLDGTWEPEMIMGDMADGVVQMTEVTDNAVEGAEEEIQPVKQDIIDGDYEIWAGPIRDQDGNLVVEEGEVLPMEDIGDFGASQDFLVEGIIGDLPD